WDSEVRLCPLSRQCLVFECARSALKIVLKLPARKLHTMEDGYRRSEKLPGRVGRKSPWKISSIMCRRVESFSKRHPPSSHRSADRSTTMPLPILRSNFNSAMAKDS